MVLQNFDRAFKVGVGLLQEEVDGGPACKLQTEVVLRDNDDALVHFVEQADVLKNNFRQFAFELHNVGHHHAEHGDDAEQEEGVQDGPGHQTHRKSLFQHEKLYALVGDQISDRTEENVRAQVGGRSDKCLNHHHEEHDVFEIAEVKGHEALYDN